VEQWAHVIFSDETAIDVRPPRVQYVRRRLGTRITQLHSTSHHPFLSCVLFWGCVTAVGPGPLIPITGTMNSKRYVDVLQQHLIPQ
jgi:hypothetical protein